MGYASCLYIYIYAFTHTIAVALSDQSLAGRFGKPNLSRQCFLSFRALLYLRPSTNRIVLARYQPQERSPLYPVPFQIGRLGWDRWRLGFRLQMCRFGWNGRFRLYVGWIRWNRCRLGFRLQMCRFGWNGRFRRWVGWLRWYRWFPGCLVGYFARSHHFPGIHI